MKLWNLDWIMPTPRRRCVASFRAAILRGKRVGLLRADGLGADPNRRLDVVNAAGDEGRTGVLVATGGVTGGLVRRGSV